MLTYEESHRFNTISLINKVREEGTENFNFCPVFDARDLEPKQVRHNFQFGRLLITQQRGGQSDTVGCYSGLKWTHLKKLRFNKTQRFDTPV